MDCTTKAEYQQPHMAAFKNNIEQEASQQELYVITVRGSLDPVPKQVHHFFKYPLPQPWKRRNTDKNFLPTDKLIKLQRKKQSSTADAFHCSVQAQPQNSALKGQRKKLD